MNDLIPTHAPYNHAASIVVLDDNEALVVWVAGSAELAPDTAILMSRRRPGAAGWTDPVVVADRPGFADANPVLFPAPGGALWLIHVETFAPSFCESRLMVQTSDDRGQTWSAPRPLFDATCVLVRNHPLALHNGRWILPAYVQSVYQSQFWVSDDGGQTWLAGAPLLTLPDNNLQPAVVELDDGSLFSLMRRAGPGTFTWEGRSDDCGWTWALQPRPELPNPNSGLDLIRLRSGILVVAYNDDPRQRAPLVVASSRDDGRTWSPPRVIAEGPPQVSYPSLAEGPDGTIHVVFSDRLSAIRHVQFNITWLDQAVPGGS